MKTNATALNPHSAVPPPGTNDIRPPKPPVTIPNEWVWFWWTLVLLAVATALYGLWRRYRRNAAEVQKQRAVPPHERARKRLQEALALMLEPKPFCILVSDTIRTYLEERFDFRAPERTTEEFLLELQTTPLLSRDQKESLGEFLNACDLVKFARYEPTQFELQGIYEAAVRLVDETEPPPPQPGASEASTTAEKA